jgi:HK97 gp10 family phage protein
MSDGIEIEGFEGLEDLLQQMTISESDEKNAMKKALEPVAKEIESNSPLGNSGRLKRLKIQVKKKDLATIGIIKTTAFYDIFQEFGTSQQKNNVGYFERSVRSKENEAISILFKNLLVKVN